MGVRAIKKHLHYIIFTILIFCLVLNHILNWQDIAVLDIKKLIPEHCFELTEVDLSKYPALREVLEEMGSKESVLYYTGKDEGYAIFDYLLERQVQVGTPSSHIPCVAQFKYKGEFYCFNLMT